MTRRWELDALRGLMLVLMTITHLPTRLSSALGQPFGYVSAAEGFVLLSAYMAGLVYGGMARKRGIEAMRPAFLRRARKVYACHAATLLFLFTVIAAVGVRTDQPAVKDLMSYYLTHPLPALVSGLLLMYQPPLLDILPMYVLFLLASPWVLIHGLRRGWKVSMGVSAGLWLLAQFGLDRWVYEATVSLTGLAVPFHDTGAFLTFSWQFLWMLGLWMGASHASPAHQPFAFPRWAVVLAVALAGVGFVWRHAVGQSPFGPNEALNLLFDKWRLAPLRLLNLFALLILAIRFGPALVVRLPRLRVLETLGAASLPVFCMQLVMVLLMLAFFGGNPLVHPVWLDALMVAVSFSVLYAVALFSAWLDRRMRPATQATAAPPAPAAQDAPAPVPPSDPPQSPTATVDNPLH